jgi:TetR/AcrR family transcriptional repressor of bet genes
MPRKPNTETRRAEIIAALRKVMARTGYGQATVQAVAREAGLAPGLIHYHFEDKREILMALVKSVAWVAGERYARMAEGARSAAARLRAYIDARLALGPGADPDAVAAWVVIGAEAIRDAKVRELSQQVTAHDRELLRTLRADYMEEQGRSAQAAPLLAASLCAFMEGAYQLASAAPKAIPKGYAADAAMQLVERFVAGEPALSRRAGRASARGSRAPGPRAARKRAPY